MLAAVVATSCGGDDRAGDGTDPAAGVETILFDAALRAPKLVRPLGISVSTGGADPLHCPEGGTAGDLELACDGESLRLTISTPNTDGWSFSFTVTLRDATGATRAFGMTHAQLQRRGKPVTKTYVLQ